MTALVTDVISVVPDFKLKNWLQLRKKKANHTVQKPFQDKCNGASVVQFPSSHHVMVVSVYKLLNYPANCAADRNALNREIFYKTLAFMADLRK